MTATLQYFMVKRENVTMFVYTEPQQTILSLKEHIANLDNSLPENIQLRSKEVVLEDNKTVQDYFDFGNEKAELRPVGPTILLLRKNEDGSWEEPNLHQPPWKPVPRDAIEAIKAQVTAQNK